MFFFFQAEDGIRDVPGAGGENVPPTGGTVVVTCSGVMAKQNEHWNSKFPWLSEARLNAFAGICIVCEPCVVTGELLKWKVIVALRLLKTNELAGVPFTVKSVA